MTARPVRYGGRACFKFEFRQVPRKRRTREHIIADLSANYVERLMLLAGYSVNRIEKDYGYDLLVTTHNETGELENGFILLQLKASDSPNYIDNGRIISLKADVRDIETWERELYPVILIMFDAYKNEAFWIYTQRYLVMNASARGSTSMSMRIPVKNKMSEKTPSVLAGYKERVYESLLAEVEHG